jgi:hypothetical protein
MQIGQNSRQRNPRFRQNRLTNQQQRISAQSGTQPPQDLHGLHIRPIMQNSPQEISLRIADGLCFEEIVSHDLDPREINASDHSGQILQISLPGKSKK